MAEVVSESLLLTIKSKEGETTLNLAEVFNSNPNRVVSVVGTVNEDGTPNTAPMSLFWAKNEKTIVAGMVRTSKTVENIKRTGRLIIEVMYDNDIVYGIIGKATVIKEPLDCNEHTLAVRIDVEKVKRDTSPAQILTTGIRITPRSEKATEYEKAVMDELKRISNEI